MWLYGEGDRYYGVDHIRTNHAAFLAAGGRAALHVLGVPGDGHRLARYPELWTGLAGDYLGGLRVAAVS